MYRPTAEVAEPPAMFKNITKVFSWMPASFRKWLVVQQNKPKEADRPKDLYEMIKEDPYTIEEVEEGKVWRVQYACEDGLFVTGKAVEKFKLFCDIAGEQGKNAIKEAAATFGVSEQIQKDMEQWEKVKKMTPEEGNSGGYAKEGNTIMSMFVVKLKNGDVLLYCPVLIHEGSSVDKLISELGPVKWVVMGSSYHTNYMPAAIKKYPEAKLIGSSQGVAKVKGAISLPCGKLDYEVSFGNQEAIAEVNKMLETEGVTLHYIEGDMLTDSIWVLAYTTMLECDSLYFHKTGCPCKLCDPNGSFWTEDKFWNIRLMNCLFRSPVMAQKDHGLPLYRFWFMNPDFKYMLINDTPADGSAYKKMAESLRLALKQKYERMACVHWPYTVTPDIVNLNINHQWSWLDGEALA